MRNLRKNRKGLSVIFGVLILIAIAVIAGIIIYMYTSGYLATMLGGGTAGQEKVAIQTIEVPTATSVKVWAKSTGGGAVSVTDVILKDSAGNTVTGGAVTLGNAVTLPADGTMTAVTATVPAMTSGQTYTVTLSTRAGNQFVSSAFKA